MTSLLWRHTLSPSVSAAHFLCQQLSHTHISLSFSLYYLWYCLRSSFVLTVLTATQTHLESDKSYRFGSTTKSISYEFRMKDIYSFRTNRHLDFSFAKVSSIEISLFLNFQDTLSNGWNYKGKKLWKLYFLVNGRYDLSWVHLGKLYNFPKHRKIHNECIKTEIEELMRKNHVTRQFFEASGPQGKFFEKTKNTFLDMV